VDEPNEPLAARMVRGLSAALEKHHGVRVLDEAVTEAVRLSHRYITDRQLPDKAISLLDTACARVALSQSATPAALEDCRRELEALQVEIASLQREAAAGAAHGPRLDELEARRRAAEERRVALEERLQTEQQLVAKVRELRQRVELPEPVAGVADPGHSAEPAADRAELAKRTAELRDLQGERPLVHPVVDGQVVAEVVSSWTGIPVGKMVLDEIKTVLNLKDKLAERVVGQAHALDAIARRIRTARANLVDPRRPVGVFLLVGPSGVGKTETALALADTLYGGDRSLIVINMSEYKEDHKISRLTGSAPGYVGYGEGGVLTEAVRRKPYCVVLLDEVEKANVAVQEIFYQVFDKGSLQDDRGTEVDFKNAIILLTSNVATDAIMRRCADGKDRPEAEALTKAIRPELLKAFKPALLGRMTVVPYYPLGDEVLRQIVRLQLGRIADRVRANYRAAFTYDEALVDAVLGRCREVESGARAVDQILTGTLLPELSQEFLSRLADGRPVTVARVGLGDDGGFTYSVG
jgi:type VI secretion system protein VasG